MRDNHARERQREVGATELPFVELDDVLQHRARIGAAVLLARHDHLLFSRLKALLQETDGNLGAQMRKLEDAGYRQPDPTGQGGRD
jgi:hypothetical protein